MNILTQIVDHKKAEVAERKALYPIRLLEESIYFEAPIVSMSQYVKREDKSGIIAEFKRRSPSKPSINLFASVEEVSMAYMQAGASALSILTDSHFFGGSSEDLSIARKYNFCPILRKDFIIDEYQIVEARSIGADAILLIAEILSPAEVKNFAKIAHDLGLEVLMEIHSMPQLEKYEGTIDLIGVNNRDLETFSTDIETSKKLYSQLPSEVTKISESGIHSTEAIHELKDVGFDGFLIGEKFMASASPGDSCRQFIQQIEMQELW